MGGDQARNVNPMGTLPVVRAHKYGRVVEGLGPRDGIYPCSPTDPERSIARSGE